MLLAYRCHLRKVDHRWDDSKDFCRRIVDLGGQDQGFFVINIDRTPTPDAKVKYVETRINNTLLEPIPT